MRIPQDGAVAHRILVVDDDLDNAETVALLVQRMGYECLALLDAKSALDEVPVFRPDLMLIDLSMPHRDGLQLARQLRAGNGATEIVLVAMSGYADPEHKALATEAGFDDYLAKPFSLAALMRVLSNLEPLRQQAHKIRLRLIETATLA